MTPARRSLLQGAASLGALSLAPWHSASAQTTAPAPAARTFNPQPGDWRTFEVTTRVDITDARGQTQAWLPVPSVDSDWQRSLTRPTDTNGKQSYIAGRVPELDFVDLLFLFDNLNQARAAMDGALGAWMTQKIEARIPGYRVLGFFENGYRHISNVAVRTEFEQAWNVTLQPEPGLRIPNMFESALAGSFKGLYCQGEDIAQSDPNTQHVTAALSAMECVVVQDIFLNETAKFAHVFLPGASFLEKDGTFTNAERRISPVRKVMPALAGKEDWEVTVALSNALGYPMNYTHPSQIMDEIASLTPTFTGVSYASLERHGSLQWPCNAEAPDGTPTMHIEEFVRGKGRFMLTGYVPTDEKVNSRYPLLLTTGRILSQYNVGAQTRRTGNVAWHDADRLEIHPTDAESRGIQDGDWVGIGSRAGQTVLRAKVSARVAPGVVYTTFHFPESGANVITTDNSDWATNCPEYKVTAVEVVKVFQPSQWQKRYQDFSDEQQRLLKERRTAEKAEVRR